MITVNLSNTNCQDLQKLAKQYAINYFMGECISPILFLGLEEKENQDKKKHFHNIFKITVNQLVQH